MVYRFLGNPHRADLADADEADFSDDEVFEMIYTLVNASPDHSDDDFTDDPDDEDYVPGDDVSDSEYDSDEPGPPIPEGDGAEDADGDFGDGESVTNKDDEPKATSEPTDVSGPVA